MGRLIDANKLIIHLADYQLSVAPYDGDSTEYHTIQNCIEAVQDQPTAYDVDKVVEELENQAKQYNRRAMELVNKSTEAGIHNKGKACSYEHAIDIVKRGGRDE